VTTARTYWIDASDLEKGLSSFLYRAKPEDLGNWVEIEVARVPEQPKSDTYPVRNHIAEHSKGMY
jgi:hypothetical protein